MPTREKSERLRAFGNINGIKLEIVGLDEFPDLEEVIEDGDSFTANALKRPGLGQNRLVY